MVFFDVRHHRFRKPPKSGRFQKFLLWRAFFKRCVFGDRFKPKCWTNLFKYIYFSFILLFTSSSPCRKHPFAILYFLQVVIVLTDSGLQLGDPAPLNGLLLCRT